jgi:hypothetical protein
VGIYKGVEGKCRFLLRLDIKFVDGENLYEFVHTGFGGLRVPEVFKESIDLPYKLTLRTKDLLHLVYAFLLSKTHNMGFSLTRDVDDFEGIRGHRKAATTGKASSDQAGVRPSKPSTITLCRHAKTSRL